MKLLIYIPGRPNVHGHKRREFIWRPEHNCHVYQGREVEAAEFNQIAEKVFRQNQDLFPLVRIVAMPEATAVDLSGRVRDLEQQVSELRETIAATPAPAEEAPAESLEPVTTITAVREVCLEEALEVVSRLAPGLLKKAGRAAAAGE